MKKMLLTRDKSSNPRIPRSATLAARGTGGSYMRKFVRTYPDRLAESQRRSDLLRQTDWQSKLTPRLRRRFRTPSSSLRQTDGQSKLTPDRFAKDERRSNASVGALVRCAVSPDRFAESKRRLSIDSDVAAGIGVSPDRFVESERRSNGNRVLRKFVRLLSVRADNRLQRKPETTSLRQGLKEAASGTINVMHRYYGWQPHRQSFKVRPVKRGDPRRADYGWRPHRQGFNGVTSGTEHEAPTEAESCKSQTGAQAVSLCQRRVVELDRRMDESGLSTQAVSLCRRRAGVAEAGICKSQTATARASVSVAGTLSVGFAVRLGLGLLLGHPHPALARRQELRSVLGRLGLRLGSPYPSLARTGRGACSARRCHLRLVRPPVHRNLRGRGACSARRCRLRLGRPYPYPSLARLQQKPEVASCRLLPTIVRSTDESHQWAERPKVPFTHPPRP